MPAGGAIVGVLTWELYYLHDILFAVCSKTDMISKLNNKDRKSVV